MTDIPLWLGLVCFVAGWLLGRAIHRRPPKAMRDWRDWYPPTEAQDWRRRGRE